MMSALPDSVPGAIGIAPWLGNIANGLNGDGSAARNRRRCPGYLDFLQPSEIITKPENGFLRFHVVFGFASTPMGDRVPESPHLVDLFR